MRLDPNELNVKSFEIPGPGTTGLMGYTDAITCVTSAPCFNSVKTCDPNCAAIDTTHEN